VTRYVVIGAGPAGINAASAIRAGDATGEIVVFDREHDRPYYRTELDTYIAGSTPDSDLPLNPDSYYDEQRIELRLRSVVARVNIAERRVELSTGERVAYDKLLLASGSIPMTLAWPGGDVGGIVTVRTWEDARAVIRHVLETTKPVLVVGGGVLGLILAEGIRQRGRSVVLLEKEPRLWAPVLDEPASDRLVQSLAEAGIVALLDEVVAEIESERGRVTGVRTSKGRRIETGLIVVAIGVRPDIGFLAGSGVRTDRGILVDREFRTNAADVFAAGDAVQAFDFLLGQTRVVTNWVNAVEQGRLAGAAMVGQGQPYRGVMVSNSESFCGVRVSVLGITQPTSGGHLVLIGRDQAKSVYRKLVLQEGRLVGALLVGNTSGEGMMRKIILDGRAVSPDELKSKFLPGLGVTEVPA